MTEYGVLPLRVFVDELARAGVREAVICPGSRSTPLALAIWAHGGIHSRVLLDERGAAFFALGMARTSGRPVALLCTSGTAAANFLPAVVEAFHGRVPLVVITADRPPELRDRGAPQTIDQTGLYGSQVKWFCELPVLDATPDLVAHAAHVAGRAVATAAAGPKGPVHLNVLLREPLIPDAALGSLGSVGAAGSQQPDSEPFSVAVEGARALTPSALDGLAGRLAGVERGLIIAGPQDDPALPASLARLAAATGYPILADPLSGLRLGHHNRSHVIAHGDLLCRPGRWIEANRPDVVIRFGAMPTSKPVVGLLSAASPMQLIVDGDGGWREAALLPSTFIRADAAAFAEGLATAVALAEGDAGIRPWTQAWLSADRAAEDVIRARYDDSGGPLEASEPEPFRRLPDLMPDGSILWAGNSMPVRDMDAYLPSGPRAIRCYANRGANGIDGVLSTALGSSAVADAPVVLVLGDLSFLHDLNALVTARAQGLSATIVLVNNDGGGIFSFLPQAAADDPRIGLPHAFETLFGTPHGTDIGAVVKALGASHRLVAAGGLGEALARALGESGLKVLEIRTDRRTNLAFHREVTAAVSAALDALLPGVAE
jgi:2-succinyl-5-enolpyruvyl-6-hydroxy-3-cyclohexene-1-carboxylate synthase